MLGPRAKKLIMASKSQTSLQVDWTSELKSPLLLRGVNCSFRPHQQLFEVCTQMLVLCAWNLGATI